MKRLKIFIPIVILTAVIIILILVFNRSIRYNNLIVSEIKWNSIISTRSENSNLILEDIEFNDYNLIIDESTSTLYYSIINDSQNKYNPNVSFKAADNVKTAILSEEITDEKVQNNYEFKIMIYNDTEYHIYKLVCTNYPILNINYKEKVKDNKSTHVEVYLFDNISDIPRRIMISSGKIKVNDTGYAFSLNMTTPGKNIRKNKISLFNMKPDSEYVLSEASGETSKTHDSHYVELFINDEHKGVYVLYSEADKEAK